MEIRLLTHSAIKFTNVTPKATTVIYFDPYDIEQEMHDADYIFITHDHFDHYDLESIKNVSKENTKIIVPECLKDIKHHLVVEPNKNYTLRGISFETIPAYNIDKDFHKREKNYVGYNVTIKGIKYYIMGDTDNTEEARNVETDVCFVPIGGTYTMDAREASDYINHIKPKIAIPIHYGKVAGNAYDEIEFKNRVNEETEVYIIMEDLSFYSDEDLKNRAFIVRRDMAINNGTNQQKDNYLKGRYRLIISELARRKSKETKENGGSKK